MTTLRVAGLRLGVSQPVRLRQHGTRLVDPATSASVQPVGQSSGWSLVASEEFDGSITVTDATNGYLTFRSDGPEWSAWYPDWPMFSALPGENHTNDNYDDYYALSKISMGSGYVNLRADSEVTVAGRDYTSGMIQSIRFLTQTYGFFEARMRLSTATANGFWPAFWTTSATYNTWPPEIDIAEWYDGPDQPVSFGVWPTYQDDPPSKDYQSSYAVADVTTWHTYGCKWDANGTTFYIDGTQRGTTGVTSDAYPQYVLLNSGTLRSAGASYSSESIDVDYVRVWEAV